MGKLSYILGCVTRMDYPELFRTVGTVHKITGKNSVGILADVVKCGLKYGAGFNDYLLCEFYNLTDAQAGHLHHPQREQHLGQPFKRPEYYHFFDNKSEFYTTFGKYIGRQWLDFGKATQKEFEDFMASATPSWSSPIPPAAALREQAFQGGFPQPGRHVPEAEGGAHRRH